MSGKVKILKRYAIKLEYVGKNYHGSQIQPNKNTVQNELNIALYTLLKSKIKTVFSGRTDKGVNAKCQIVHFETDKSIVASQFIHSLNGLLPNDISVCADSGLKEVPKTFHAQKSAKKRIYKYVFINRKYRSAFDEDLMLVKWDLNIQRMQKALDYLKGEHDFSTFRSSKSTTENRICFIYKAECKKLDDTIEIIIEGNRFLHNMVRTIVGTLLLIERNNLPSKTMQQILESKDRTKAGKTVNPHGLTLMKVEY